MNLYNEIMPCADVLQNRFSSKYRNIQGMADKKTCNITELHEHLTKTSSKEESLKRSSITIHQYGYPMQ